MCPNCKKPVLKVRLKDVAASTWLPMAQEWRAISHCCYECGVVLSVQIDPIAIKADTIAAIKGKTDCA
jgi:hypothetical protein